MTPFVTACLRPPRLSFCRLCPTKGNQVKRSIAKRPAWGAFPCQGVIARWAMKSRFPQFHLKYKSTVHKVSMGTTELAQAGSTKDPSAQARWTAQCRRLRNRSGTTCLALRARRLPAASLNGRNGSRRGSAAPDAPRLK